MSEKTVIITEAEGKYKIQNNGISEFALIGILESILFDLKSVNRREETITDENETVNEEELPVAEITQASAPPPPEVPAPLTMEKAQESNAPELRTRIGNAVKAITALGGQISEVDLSKMSDEELQSELDDLTNQYKRLKKSKEAKK